MTELYIGLMSGTSIDSIDAVLVEFDSNKSRILNSTSVDYDEDTRKLLHSLCSPSDDEIEKAGVARVKIAEYEAKAVNSLLDEAGIKPIDVKAIGSHGQTVRHRPSKGFSLQLDNGALLCALTRIDTVCDFRSADIAHGGNGAPLTQAFHSMQFRDDKKVSMVLNLGGISNLTVVDTDGRILEAFDTGPANTLIDGTCRTLLDIPYDKDAKLALKGKVIPALLEKYMQSPYLKQEPPKSTGREDFGLDFIKEELLFATQDETFINDLIATLSEFTVMVNVNAIRMCMYRHKISDARLVLCGGGAYNPYIKTGLEKNLQKNNVSVMTAEDLNVNSKLLEAHAFAFFAYKFMHRECLRLGDSTGAREPSILGCLYPAVH